MAGARTIFIDYDARRDPKTSLYCVKCQRDLGPNQPRRWVHLVGGGGFVLHPQDETAYVPDGGDLGAQPIGLDCARQLGLEWSIVSEELDAIAERLHIVR